MADKKGREIQYSPRSVRITCGLLLVLVVMSGSLILREQRQSALNSELFAAITHEDSRAVLQVLDRGADANARRPAPDWILRINESLLARFFGKHNQMTPLMEAAEHSNAETVKILLEHGADVEATAGDGTTALKLAREFNSRRGQEIIRLLQRATAKE